MIYISGRTNLACTIFVPYDCKNNCPFCTSKAMYKNADMNLEKILKMIHVINGVSVVSEFVITGGEPFANLRTLMEIVNACHKRVFINTTLPIQDNLEEVIDYINYEPKIQGVNISRHMSFNFSNVADVDTIMRIKKPIRINSVITNVSDINSFLNKWAYVDNVMVNLRADYRKITRESLKVRDEIDDWCLAHYYYKGNNSCMVCNSEFFGDKYITFCYHRGLEKSSFVCGEHCYVNDIIIYPNGNCCKDWTPTDVDRDFIMELSNNKIL